MARCDDIDSPTMLVLTAGEVPARVERVGDLFEDTLTLCQQLPSPAG